MKKLKNLKILKPWGFEVLLEKKQYLCFKKAIYEKKP